MKQDRRSQTDTLIAPVLRVILKRFGGINSIDLDGLPSALADQIIENDFKKICSAQIFSKNSSPDFGEVCQLSGAGQTIFTRFSEEIDNEYAVTVNEFREFLYNARQRHPRRQWSITVIMPAAAADRTPMCESSRARGFAARRSVALPLAGQGQRYSSPRWTLARRRPPQPAARLRRDRRLRRQPGTPLQTKTPLVSGLRAATINVPAGAVSRVGPEASPPARRGDDG